jgi:soluble lytic murein transglycosylase-like protein
MSIFNDFFAQFTKSSAAPVDNSFVGGLTLLDVEPGDQGGVWKDTYDYAFEQARDSIGVPFALLKAHAIRESALKPGAYRQEPSGKASYGLMQVLWWKNSNRFALFGYPDDSIGDGSLLYDPVANCLIAASIIKDNWQRLGNLRDTINAYNTGVKESVRVAPGNYVNDVLKNYSTLIGKKVT